MAKRKTHSASLKSKVALEAIKGGNDRGRVGSQV